MSCGDRGSARSSICAAALVWSAAYAVLPGRLPAQDYFGADGRLRVSLAQQPLSPNGRSDGPRTMAFGGIQGILARMNATVRLAESALTGDEEQEYGGWKRLGMSLGHFADIVAEDQREGWFTVGLFATCPSMPGMVAGLQRSPTGGPPLRVGMLWLDAHPDFNTPETTRSGSLGGMPVAVATGRALHRMRLDATLDPALRDEQVVMGGVRLTDPLEQALLDSSGIEQVSVEDLRTRSAALWVQLDRLHRENDRLYVHIDLDVLDPSEVAHHQNAVPGGPSSEDLAALFDSIFTRYPKASAIGFATIPTRDDGGLALAAVNRMIAGAARGVMRRRQTASRREIEARGMQVNWGGDAWDRNAILMVDDRLRRPFVPPRLGRDPKDATWLPPGPARPLFGSRGSNGAFVMRSPRPATAFADSLHREAFTVTSEILGESRPINVYTPPEYRRHPHLRLPVLYMPDGGLEEDFPHVAATVDSLIASRAIRPVILVGIPNTQRRRDLTGPTRVASDSAIAPRVGGSAAFRAFVRDELMPAINELYRTTDERVIIGESLAGLFVLETFLAEPQLFTGYIAFDPSLWWDRGSLVEGAAPRFGAAHRAGRTLFVSASKDDIDGLTTRLDGVMRSAGAPGLAWHFTPRPDLTHATIFRAMKSEALAKVLAP